jgi:uncharacterized integral membrane protein
MRRWLRQWFWRDDLQLLRAPLFWNHLHRVLLFHDDDHLVGSSRWHGNRGWRSSRGCGGVTSIIVIFLIFIFIVIILTHVVESILVGHLHDQLIMGLDHPLEIGLLLLQLLGGIFLLLAQGL